MIFLARIENDFIFLYKKRVLFLFLLKVIFLIGDIGDMVTVLVI